MHASIVLLGTEDFACSDTCNICGWPDTTDVDRSVVWFGLACLKQNIFFSKLNGTINQNTL